MLTAKEKLSLGEGCDLLPKPQPAPPVVLQARAQGNMVKRGIGAPSSREGSLHCPLCSLGRPADTGR